jgi:uncharacterized damage-inducible protein DinB
VIAVSNGTAVTPDTPSQSGRLRNTKENAMTQAAAAASDLARVTAAEFARYFRHLAARVDLAARSVTEDQFWSKPFPFGNSIGHLVLHLTGNLSHYIGALVGGAGSVRHREHEFSDTVRHPRDELLARFAKTIEMVASTLEEQDAASFMQPVAEQPPIETRLGLFLVCAAHLNNHIGQISYLVQALNANTNEPPIW